MPNFFNEGCMRGEFDIFICRVHSDSINRTKFLVSNSARQSPVRHIWILIEFLIMATMLSLQIVINVS